MCRSWVCSEGIYKQNKGSVQSDSANAASGFQASMDGFQNIMDFFNNACKGGFRS